MKKYVEMQFLRSPTEITRLGKLKNDITDDVESLTDTVT
jgi:hypothetical protein